MVLILREIAGKMGSFLLEAADANGPPPLVGRERRNWQALLANRTEEGTWLDTWRSWHLSPLTRPAIFPSYTTWTLFKIHSTMHTNVGFCWDGTFVTAQKRSHCVISRGLSRNMPNSTTHGPDLMSSSCNQYEPRGRDSSRDCVCAGILF